MPAPARFVEPMLFKRTEKLPEGPEWLVELKLDGYRALALKTRGKVQLRSRKDNDFNGRYPRVVKGLAPMPDETVLDGEVVALDASGDRRQLELPPQQHVPGRLGQSDFTRMNDLGILLNGQTFPHMLFHFVLTYSNWEAATVCYSDSFESLSEGLQNALWGLGA